MTSSRSSKNLSAPTTGGGEMVVQLESDNGDVISYERRGMSSTSNAYESPSLPSGNLNNRPRPSSPVSPSSGGIFSRKSFKKVKFLPRLGSKERLPTLEVTENMDRLNDIIADRKMRQELVSALLAMRDSSAVKIRFIAAADEFERTTGKIEKKAKGNKIVATFVQNGSMFQIPGIPAPLVQALESYKLDKIADLKNFILDDLVRNETVAKLMKEMIPQRIVYSYQIPS